MRTFNGGAVRDEDNYKLDYEGFLNPLVLEAYGEYMHHHRKMTDGTLRDSDNWQKGFGKSVVAKSLIRHAIEFWKDHRGYQVTDRKSGKHVYIKDILCAIIFNAQAYLLEVLKEEDEINDPIGAKESPREVPQQPVQQLSPEMEEDVLL